MNGGGREGDRRDDEVRGARRIPGPRGAVDDLDLETVERPVLPPPGGSTPDEAVPEQGAPEGDGDVRDAVPEAGAADEPDAVDPDAVDAVDEPYAVDEPDAVDEPEPAMTAATSATPATSAATPVLSHQVLKALLHELIRTASLAGRNVAERSVSYGDFALPLQDALLDRAFECWVHGTDIAEAVDYPYKPPSAAHLHRMIDLAARLLPAALAGRRSAGLAGPAKELVAPGEPGRSVHLEVEGHGGGDWYIPLDSPAAVGSPRRAVAQVALDGVEFCQLVAGHISPVEAAAGQEGDREAIRDVLFASASLSRL
ncbi:hypothetical protein SMICM17S_04285 [Streptomyces microflavus]